MAAERHDVVVVGLGAMGAAALYQLARRGLDVVGIDRHRPPHVHGSTHGESRITREAVGEGDAYVPLVRRSHAIWRELEVATGRDLFTACGGLVIGRRDGGFLDETIAIATRHGIAHELLDRAAMAERFPHVTGLATDEIGYLEPGAGFVRPEACVAAQLGEAARLGAAIRTDVAVSGVRETGDGVAIETEGGVVRAAHAVVAVGAWTGALLGAPFDRLLRVTRQTLFWFACEAPALYDAARCPVFIRDHRTAADGSFYGFPLVDPASGVKLATEDHARDADPAAYRAGHGDDEAAGFFARHVAGRLAGLGAPVRSATCLYTSTADARFVIAPHPAMPRVLAVSACSGHGFKHSAAIGELVAERVRSALRLAPFAA